MLAVMPCFFFFFNDTATTEIYTISLHDALPISKLGPRQAWPHPRCRLGDTDLSARSEEHTSELQSQSNLVCRLLLEKKNERRGTTFGLELCVCNLVPFDPKHEYESIAAHRGQLV